MVAPSFVMVTSPMSSTSILSKPSGPSELFTMLAIELAAITTNEKSIRISKLSHHVAYADSPHPHSNIHCTMVDSNLNIYTINQEKK